MRRLILFCLALVLALAGGGPAVAVDYFWNNSNGGAYDEPSNWTPFTPPATQGPGGANDTVNFDLGIDFFNRYVVTDAGRENSRLIVHNDTVELTIFLSQTYSNSGNEPSLVVGAANGDVGNLVLSSGGASVLQTEVARLGNAAGSEGRLTVRGLQWNGDNLRVGYAGVGAMTIEQDAAVSSVNASIAHLSGSSGLASVRGSWDISGNLNVGRQGQATLGLNFGSSVSSNTAVIGDLSAGVGEVTVAGAWSTTSSLTVGDSGDGTLNINLNGAVVGADAFVGRQTGSSGLVSAGGGNWTVNGRLSIAGDADAATSGGDGTVEITGGTVAVTEDVTVFPNGEIVLDGGSLDAPIITMQTGGVLAWTGGVLSVDTFNGSLSNNGGTLASREGSNSIFVTGEFAQSPAGTLSIEIAGSAASGQFDKLTVGNSAFLGGELEVDLAGAFQPLPGEAYTIADALNIGAGSFSNVASGQRLTVNRGRGTFLVNYGAGSPFDPSQIVLSDYRAPLDADFDGDGDVDGADLAQWQGDFGANAFSDADNDGDSDGADFLAWQQQLGFIAPAAPVAVPVPEPSSLKLLSLTGSFLALLRPRRQPLARSPHQTMIKHCFRA